MFGPKSYLHGGGVNAINGKTPLIYFDIRVASPYKDLILIKESQLETHQYHLTGKLIISINEDVTVKKISLKLTGRFKLDFLQLDHGSGVTSIVKDQKAIFETKWNNLLTSSHGELLNNPDKISANHPMRSFSAPVVNRLIKKKSHTTLLLELPPNAFNGTPFPNLDPGSSYHFHLPKGNYELPFDVTLPQDVPDTIEGLQSGSILYNFEAAIERPQKMYFHNHGFTAYKYLRIFRTLAPDHLALQQDVTVGNTYVDKLQYKISIPSKAIPIGTTTPINIELFPFRKGYKLLKIAASLIQYFVIHDSSGNIYDDETVINKKSMTEFSDFQNVQENLLVGNTFISSLFQLPNNLKRLTQDVESSNDLIHVRHRISVHIMLTHIHDHKSLEIKANLPVLLYVCPDTNLQGRLVLLDNTNGNIHFRPNEFITLFNPLTSASSSRRPSPRPAAFALPPPNYCDRLKDCLLNTANTRSAPVSPTISHLSALPPFTKVISHDDLIDGPVIPVSVHQLRSLSPLPAPAAPTNTDLEMSCDSSHPEHLEPPHPDLQNRTSVSYESASAADHCQVPSYEQTMQQYPDYPPN